MPYLPDRDFPRDTKLLQIAASMVGLAMKVAQLVAADRQRLLDENQLLRHELRERYELRNLVGNSHAMGQVFEQVAQAAPANTTVLIRGESGTGKELVARAIHYSSPARGEALHQGQLRRPAGDPDRIRTLRRRGRAPSPTPATRAPGGSSWPTAAPCSWTRSASCPRPPR